MFESSAAPPPRFKPPFPFRVPSLSLRGARAFTTLLRLSLFLLPFLFLRACLLTYVPPDQIGLRQVSFGPSKGLQKELVQPGYRRSISGYETIRTFPRNIQAVEFTNDESERGADHRTIGAVNVPTVDGYPITVDCTVLYRIADPFLVVSKFGFGRGYEDNVVIRFTDPAIKQHLGEYGSWRRQRTRRRRSQLWPARARSRRAPRTLAGKPGSRRRRTR